MMIVLIGLRSGGVSVEQCLGLGNNVLHGEAKLLQAGAARSGGAEAVHGDAVAIEADEAVPAEGFSGFHHKALAHGTALGSTSSL